MKSAGWNRGALKRYDFRQQVDQFLIGTCGNGRQSGGHIHGLNANGLAQRQISSGVEEFVDCDVEARSHLESGGVESKGYIANRSRNGLVKLVSLKQLAQALQRDVHDLPQLPTGRTGNVDGQRRKSVGQLDYELADVNDVQIDQLERCVPRSQFQINRDKVIGILVVELPTCNRLNDFHLRIEVVGQTGVGHNLTRLLVPDLNQLQIGPDPGVAQE